MRGDQPVPHVLRLDPAEFDFCESFPVPLDDEMRKAGRPGLLDQKEDSDVSDAQWIALQHRAWFEELHGFHLERAYLQACIKAHVDPGTGQAPRAAAAWSSIETRARAEVLHIDVTVSAILSDYGAHFGCKAAEAFVVLVHAAVRAERDVGPPQRALFTSGGTTIEGDMT